ncbi:retrovirus-related pol polyprotein from type-1 retrotransposable element r1 [Lasius niger]|uniref:Retrovirus-related pol polyprotein from type-1 retrotransposable element r1 n=1 Tax=Lasius niger TaxID=67767 RepID=A0A0J7KXW7_LASNI|nr:retrovirus-related pol polyprotein from type-1 retrotransposable element r1 [Lasius niger]
MGNPPCRKIGAWLEGGETETKTLSNHRHIEFSVAAFPREVLERRRLREANNRGWVLRKLDENVFQAAINAALIVQDREANMGLTEQRAWLFNIVEQACDAAVSKIKAQPWVLPFPSAATQSVTRMTL